MRLLTLPLIAFLSLALLGQAAAPSNLELAGQVLALQKQLAALQEKIAALEQENAALRARLDPASRPTTTSRPATRPVTTKPATLSQDGSGLYRVTAGNHRKFSIDVRAKSRQDALNQGLQTVAKKAMDFDENSEIGPMTVEKISE